MIKPILLSGGSGSRLWPLSRELFPKQFLTFSDKTTLFQNTVQRVAALEDRLQPLTICNIEHRFIVAEQLHALGVEGEIILEPVGRNTAPAITVAALLHQELDPVLLVLPSDHLIAPQEAFAQAVQSALPYAEEGALVTFGITPASPETGYGYIRRGPAKGKSFCISAFVEKPDASQAQSMIDSGDHYWNSGIFMFKASVLLEEMHKFGPEILDACRKAVQSSVRDLDFVRLDKNAFSACPADSLDYVVMEKTDRGIVTPVDVQWNDLGSWTSLFDVGEKDACGNTVSGDVLLQDANNCFLHSNDKLLAAVGIEDIVAVVTSDAVLVAHKNKSQDVKEVVVRLRESRRNEAMTHSKVYRPWGWYETTDTDKRFQVKRITVKPGHVLSLQKHHHRAEHWVVVSGTAEITNGDKKFLLSEDQSTYIPIGIPHRLANPGKIPLEIIEVQTGPYLGEDDIVRMDDIYDRLKD